MVDINEINRMLKQFFITSRYVSINPQTGVVDSDEHVAARGHIPFATLPVQFGIVDGDFELGRQNSLINLKGSPQVVSGNYIAKGTFATLEGAPRHVSGKFVAVSNQLISLEHLPTFAKELRLNITPQLPLLKLLTHQVRLLTWGYPVEFGDAVNRNQRELTQIIRKYLGSSRAAAFKAAREIINKGEQLQQEQNLDHNPFERNARW
jgi:hypothetical protein